MEPNKTPITASEALAYGALDAGVQLATGYPGSPSTETFEALLRLAPDDLRIEWAINEKSAFDIAFGASLAGVRSLLCVKGVGLNVALDSLMVANLAPGTGPFVILTGDDPGGWGSQNEEDSRLLAAAAEVPLLEPTSADEAQAVMARAFAVSGRFRVPVVVRITRALAAEGVSPAAARQPLQTSRGGPHASPYLPREPDRFNVLPIHVVEMHGALQGTLQRVQAEFEKTDLNATYGDGSFALIAAGHVYHKLMDALALSNGGSREERMGAKLGDARLRLLRLGTLYPLPEQTILSFLGGAEQVLVLEELAPFVETQVQAVAQRAGICVPIYGRSSGHLPRAGELSASHIAEALTRLLPGWTRPALEKERRAMPSRQPLCDDCPYRPTFESLLAVMDCHGGRSSFVVTGETGCMVRGALPPWEMLDVKYAMGSSLGLATGLALAGLTQHVVALAGDSALLHSGLGELIDAAQARVRLLVIVLANGTTALSGGQPHPSAAYDARGNPRTPVDLAALIAAAGAACVRTVDPMDRRATQAAIEEGLGVEGLAVVIAQSPCPRFGFQRSPSLSP